MVNGFRNPEMFMKLVAEQGERNSPKVSVSGGEMLCSKLQYGFVHAAFHKYDGYAV